MDGNNAGGCTLIDLKSALTQLDPDGTLREAIRVSGSRGGTSASNSPVIPFVHSDELPDDQSRISRASLYVSKMPVSIQGQDGSSKLYAAANAVAHGFALDETAAFEVIWNHFNPLCLPPWSEREIQHKIADALTKPHREPRGYLCVRDSGEATLPPGFILSFAPRDSVSPAPNPSSVGHKIEGNNALAEIERLNPSEDDPRRIACGILSGYTHKGKCTLAYWRENFYQWVTTHWQKVKINERITRGIITHFTTIQQEAMKRFESGDIDSLPRMGKFSTALAGNVKAVLQMLTYVEELTDTPTWVANDANDLPNPSQLVSAKNGLVNLPGFLAGESNAITEHTPTLFNLNAVEFTVSPNPAEPVRWLAFLRSQWGDDLDSIKLLQEWFGYLLTSDTSKQVCLKLVGAKRSGKGTICKILRALIGRDNCCDSTLDSLPSNFGLEPLLDKSVCFLEDAAFGNKSDKKSAARVIKNITGEDSLGINRKHQGFLNVRLKTRLVITANEPLDFKDPSGAIASRFCILQFNVSHAKKPNRNLESELLAELPGIFCWAIEGWRRLRDQVEFTVPESSRDARDDLEDASDPIIPFVKNCCLIGPNESVSVSDIYETYVKYCESIGERNVPNKITFGRKLKAANPVMKSVSKWYNGRSTKAYEGISVIPDDSFDFVRDRITNSSPDSSPDFAKSGDGKNDQNCLEL
jgi:putative DNA primase/helicase